MLQRQTQTAAYWTTSFRLTSADIEHLMAYFLEEGKPLTIRDLAIHLIGYRLAQEEKKIRKQIDHGEVFQPKASYEIGQELIFPAFDFSVGKVIGKRDTQNPEAGQFTVIEVEFEDKQLREFASMLTAPHKLNLDEAGGQRHEIPSLDAHTVMADYGDAIVEELEARLADSEDFVYFAGEWFLRSLLIEINVGQLHLAEAILDMNEGGPLPTGAFLKDLDITPEAPDPLRAFSLSIAMTNDERFDEVGPTGKVMWYLRRLEPPEVLKSPARLLYQPLEYDHSLLTEELLALEQELDDELSELEPPEQALTEAMLTLIYPHRRAGTLPLTSRVWKIFPSALEAPRIRITLVDGQTQEEFPGWVVPEQRYVFGLDPIYRRYRLPIGAYVTVKATDDPARVVIDFDSHRPRTEYIRLAVPVDGRLTFANFKRSIGAGYDELLIVGAEDLEAVDSVWSSARDRKRGLVDVMRDLVPELSRLNPQNAVHAKTLYSAVNIVRRCPPGPIFAALIARTEFQHVGGPYWRLSS